MGRFNAAAAVADPVARDASGASDPLAPERPRELTVAGKAQPRTVPRGRYKRPFDLALLSVAAVLLAPFWLLLWVAVSLAIRVEDGGPVYYIQRRLGRGGRSFNLVKFRTMRKDAERVTGPVWASKQDPRLTRVGAVLRRFHLDELPQVVNVFRGEMSLVGPRPERPEIAEQIERVLPKFVERLRVRPGIAGLAQARASYHTSPRQKLRYDRLYIEAMSPLLDMRLLGLSVAKALVPTRWWVAPRSTHELGDDGFSHKGRQPGPDTQADPGITEQGNGRPE